MTVPTARVKVFGERNTGTRAVLRMLRRSENVSDYLFAAGGAWDTWDVETCCAQLPPDLSAGSGAGPVHDAQPL